jgi:hypothetical protein
LVLVSRSLGLANDSFAVKDAFFGILKATGESAPQCYALTLSRILDMLGGFGAIPFGYNHPKIWQAIHSVEANQEPGFAVPSLLDVPYTLHCTLLVARLFVTVCSLLASLHAISSNFVRNRSST